jgi:hypothetical protein
MWRNMIGLQFQLVAELGMALTRGHSKLFLEWYGLYRKALVYRGISGDKLQAALRKVLEPDLL